MSPDLPSRGSFFLVRATLQDCEWQHVQNRGTAVPTERTATPAPLAAQQRLSLLLTWIPHYRAAKLEGGTGVTQTPDPERPWHGEVDSGAHSSSQAWDLKQEKHFLCSFAC